MADQKDVSPLSVSIMRGLTDKLVERRKGAALELERSVGKKNHSETLLAI